MILQTQLPYSASVAQRLPGVHPMAAGTWLHVDEAYAAQMSERARLLAHDRAAVLWLDPTALPAVRELLDTVLAALPAGFSRKGERVTRPDGVDAQVDRDDPLATLAHLVQEDFCLLEKRGAEHVLTAALLCFPAGWRLAQKAGRPLVAIHSPVPEYDANIARRVQRLFDGVQVGRPLWRANALWYDDPALFQPRSEDDPRPLTRQAEAPYFRSERQSLVRLPSSGAVVFAIHTYVLARADALAAGVAPAQ